MVGRMKLPHPGWTAFLAFRACLMACSIDWCTILPTHFNEILLAWSAYFNEESIGMKMVSLVLNIWVFQKQLHLFTISLFPSHLYSQMLKLQARGCFLTFGISRHPKSVNIPLLNKFTSLYENFKEHRVNSNTKF